MKLVLDFFVILAEVYRSPIKKSKKQCSPTAIILKRISILQWIPKYTKSDIIADLIAGITVGLTMIPQSIAYASIAGLPAQYGLYTAFIGSFTYVIFGTIKEVSIGPTTLMSMLTWGYTAGLGVDYVILLTFLVGCVEMIMGILKLGFLVDFVSPCVTSGFTSAMAVVLSCSQFKSLFGLTKFSNHNFIEILKQLTYRYRDIRIPDTLLGLSGIIFLFVMKQLPKIKVKTRSGKKILWLLSISRNFILLVITMLIAFCCHQYWGESPFLLSGNVPSGLPAFKLPKLSVQNNGTTVGFVEMVYSLSSGIIVVPIAAVLANVAIAKAFANGIIVDATQEMMTLGLCNIFGSFIQALPSCGAFTRSAVASSSGVRTPLQGIYSGSIIILALTFLTPTFYYIPKTILGAILISAVLTVIDYEIYPKLWKCNKFDFCLTLTTLLVGIFLGVEMALIAGAIINLFVLCKVWARPKITKEIRSNQKGKEFIYIRPELGLYYPSLDYFTTTVAKIHQDWPELPIAIDCINIIRVDYSATQMLNNLLTNYNKTDTKMSLINLKEHIYKHLKDEIQLDDGQIYKSRMELYVFNKDNGGEIAGVDPLLDANLDRKLSLSI